MSIIFWLLIHQCLGMDSTGRLTDSRLQDEFRQHFQMSITKGDLLLQSSGNPIIDQRILWLLNYRENVWKWPRQTREKYELDFVDRHRKNVELWKKHKQVDNLATLMIFTSENEFQDKHCQNYSKEIRSIIHDMSAHWHELHGIEIKNSLKFGLSCIRRLEDFRSRALYIYRDRFQHDGSSHRCFLSPFKIDKVRYYDDALNYLKYGTSTEPEHAYQCSMGGIIIVLGDIALDNCFESVVIADGDIVFPGGTMKARVGDSLLVSSGSIISKDRPIISTTSKPSNNVLIADKIIAKAGPHSDSTIIARQSIDVPDHKSGPKREHVVDAKKYAENIRFFATEDLGLTLDPKFEKLLVQKIDKTSALFGKLQTGDVIEMINGKKMATFAETRRALRESLILGHAEIRFLRGQEKIGYFIAW